MIDISKRTEEEQRNFKAAMYLYRKDPKRFRFEWYGNSLVMWGECDRSYDWLPIWGIGEDKNV